MLLGVLVGVLVGVTVELCVNNGKDVDVVVGVGVSVFVGVGVRYVHPQAPLDIVPLPEILVTLIAHN